MAPNKQHLPLGHMKLILCFVDKFEAYIGSVDQQKKKNRWSQTSTLVVKAAEVGNSLVLSSFLVWIQGLAS